MVLIIAPVSVLEGWAKEAKTFLPEFTNKVRIVKVHGGNQRERMTIVRNSWRQSSNDRPQ
jgi:SNF2 family DNA or RNA helicase